MEEEQNIQPIENKNVPEEMSGMLTTSDGVSIDPFNSPTPGESLTLSPDTKFPWERPPQYTEVRPYIEDIFLAITEEDKYIDQTISLYKPKEKSERLYMIRLNRTSDTLDVSYINTSDGSIKFLFEEVN